MLTVLVVDDDRRHRELLARRLQGRGFRVITASGGADAIAMARAQRPDVVLMDLQMPDCDGWQATRALKAAPDTAAIPVVALTASEMNGERRISIDVGCDAFEAKPTTLRRLVQTIEAVCSAPVSGAP